MLPREGRCVCSRAVEDTGIRQQDGARQGTAKVRLTVGTTSGNEDPSHQTNSASSNRRLRLRLFGRRSETLTVGISRRPFPAPWSPFPVQAPLGPGSSPTSPSHGCLTAVSPLSHFAQTPAMLLSREAVMDAIQSQIGN